MMMEWFGWGSLITYVLSTLICFVAKVRGIRGWKFDSMDVLLITCPFANTAFAVLMGLIYQNERAKAKDVQRILAQRGER